MIKRLLLIFLIVFSFKNTKAQCPQVFNYLGVLSSNPYWISCTGGAYLLNFQSNTSWGSYTISWGDGTPNHTGTSYTSGSLITHNYIAQLDTHVVTLTIPSLNCTLTGVVVQEKPVNASIQIPLGGVTQACAPKALQFINSSTDVSQTTYFQWDFGDGSPLANFNYSNASTTVTHTYQKNTVNCQTQVTLKAWNYCSQGNTTIATYNPIQIYDIDDAAITPDKITKCWPDNSFTFTNTTNRNCVPQGNTFQRQEWWNFGNYWGMGHDSILNWKPWPPTTPITIAYPSVGSYTVMLRDSNLCGIDTAIITVNIVNPPTAGMITPPNPLCQNAPLTFTNTSTPNVSYSWNWGQGLGFQNTGAGNQTHTFNTSGTFTVQHAAFIPGAGPACTSTVSSVVNILPAPIANFTNNPSSGCGSLSNVMFVESSINAVAWNWNFANTFTSNLQAPPLQNYTTTGLFTPTLVVTGTNTCKGSKTATLIVRHIPTASFSPNSVCVGTATQYSNSSTVTGTNAITSYTWDFGNGSSNSFSTNPIFTYTAPGTYTVQLTATTGFCSNTATNIVTANVKPTSNFVFTPTVNCPPYTPTFTNTSSNGINYLWDFGVIPTATSNLLNPTFTYTNTSGIAQNYTVILIALTGAGCSDTIKKPIQIYPRPVASFTGNLSGACSPLPVTFTNTSVGANTYTWSFGDATGSAAMNPSHTYTNASLVLQVFTITMVASNSVGCSDTSIKTIQVFPQPFFNFTMIPAQGCTPLSINFPPVLGAVTYTWNFGDGSPLSNSANPTHVFTNTTITNQTYSVTLMASNGFGCKDTTMGYPIIFSKPIANFAPTPTVGCSPLVVSINNTSTLSTNNNWIFDNGQTSTLVNPSTTYTHASGSGADIFTIKLKVNTINNCSDSTTRTINLLPRPKSNFNVDTPACSPKILTFNNSSLGSTSYLWNFGNSNTSTNVSPTQQYINNTNANQFYNVQLVSFNLNNCTDTLKMPLIIHPKPNFFIRALPDSGCTPLKVFFPPINGVTKYNWIFGDGNSSNSGSVTNSYVNVTNTTRIFSVQLIAKDVYNCADTDNVVIKVFPKPTALFNADPLTVFVPNVATQCYNLSSGASTYQWNFGDGGTSTEVNPAHTYVNAGEFQIRLIAISNNGCRDTFNLPSQIIALEESEIQIPNAFTPNPAGSPGSIYNKNDLNNDIFHPVVRGVSKYQFSIYSRWGELLFDTKNPEEGWDGYYKGKLCTQDVYVWKITATFIDGKTYNKAGDVLLIK